MAKTYSQLKQSVAEARGNDSTKKSGSAKAGQRTYEQLKSSVKAFRPVGAPSAYEQGVINDLTGRLGDYEWKSAYTYDIWDEEDAKRKENGEMPLYQYNRYDFSDPVDKYLYDNGLPPKKDLEGFVEKAEKEAETAAEETAYEQYRAQIEDAKKGAADNGWFTQMGQSLKDAKFDNPGVQSRWDRMIWEMQNMQAPTTKELQPYVDALIAGGEYKNEKEATEAAKDQYRKEQEQKWLEYVGAPKDAEGNFLYGSKYAYEGRVVANEMTQAALNSADFKTLEQLQAEAEAEKKQLGGIYKTTEMTSQGAQPIYLQMTDEQKAAYYYYKERGYGDEYLDALAPELTEKAATAAKEYYTQDIIGSALLSLTGGLESGVKGLIRLVNDDYAARTEGVSSQAAQQNRAEVAQGDDIWSKLAGIGLDVLYSAGNMVPSMVAGTANPVLGAVAIGASSAGNAIKEARKEGATEEQAITYGLMSGTAEAALQYLLGGVAKLGKGVTRDALGKGFVRLFGRVLKDPKVVQAFKARAGSILAEAGEEYIQGIIDPVIRNIALNEDNIISLINEEAGYGALLGAITGGLLGGGNSSAGVDATADATIDTPTAETPAQAKTEVPVEQTYKPELVDTRILVGDTVILDDGTEAVVRNVGYDPMNNMEMYTVERDGKTEIVNSLNAKKRTTLDVWQGLGIEKEVADEINATFVPASEKDGIQNLGENEITQETMMTNRKTVADMEPVLHLTGKEFPKTNKSLKDRVVAFFETFGKRAKNPVLGSVDMTTSSFRDDIAHGFGNEKVAAFAAVPSVISQGKVIEFSNNWKGRNYDTALIAAPIMFNDVPAYMGVRVIRKPDSQRYTVHEIVLETQRDRASAFSTWPTAQSEGTRAQGDPMRNVLQNLFDVKSNSVRVDGDPVNDLEAAISEYNAEEEAMARLEREGREMEQWISEGYSENTAREIMESADGATLPVMLAQEETGSALLPAEQANKLADSVTELSARGVRPTKTLDQNLDYAAHNNRKLRNVLHEVFVKDWREGQRREATNRVQTVDRYLKEAERIGIERGSLEEQATMWYGQGYKAVQNETGDWVPQPYGIRDLMNDCPDTWRKVVEFDRVNREIYDRYARDLTEMYKRIYPNVEERASRQLESAAARSQQREADYEAAQNRVRELEAQLMEAETALSNKGRTDTKAFETVQNRVNRLERQLTEAQQNMLRRKELADKANVLLMNLDHSVKDGSFFQGKRFFPRANYYAHMMSDSDSGVIKAINELRAGSRGISPQLAGKSEFTKPKIRFAGFTQRRTGVYSELSTIDAMLKYIDIAEYKLAYDPVVAKAREATEVIRQSAAMSPGKGEKTTTQNLEPLLDYLDQWTNKLAGKTIREDRTLMGYVTREGLKLVKAINSRVKANAIVGNAMSAVAQVCNIPVAASFVSNPVDWKGGATLMTRAHHGNGGEAKAAFDNSPIMQQRYLDRRMRQVNPEGSSALQKLTNAMLEGGDLVSSELMWYSAYNMYNRLDGEVGSKFTRDYENAADFADDVVQRSVAARGAGDIPLTQQSELIKLLAPLQIEVNNQWQTLKSQLSKKTTGSRDIKSIVAMSVATYLLNELLELATGDRKAGFDFIQTFADIYELFADDEGTVSSDVADAAGRLGGEVLSDVPGGAYFGMLLTGGNDDVAEKLFGEADPTRYGVGNMGISAWADPIIALIQGRTVDPLATLSNIALPYGGKQVKRMVETAQNQGWISDVQFSTKEGFTTRQAQTPTSYTNTGEVRYAADTDPLNILKSVMFGQYATDAGRAYIGNGMKTLKGDKVETYNALAAAGMDGKDIMEQLNTLAGFKEIKEENYEISAANQKREHIEDSDLTTAQQMILMGSIDSSFTENARAAKELGISNEQFLEYEYARVRIEVELQEYRRDHGGKTPKGGKGKLLMEWLRSQNFTELQAIYLYELHNDGGTGVPGKWKGWD